MYVYWWHVRGLEAVKVGHADDPRQHVSDYRRAYGLGGKDVRGYRLDGSIDAEWVEKQLCRMLETWGLGRIALESDDGEEELFSLDGATFEEIQERLRHAARHIVLAEVSNRRKRQARQALHAVHAVQEPAPQETAPLRDPIGEVPSSQPYRAGPRFRFPVAAQLGLFLVGGMVAWGLVTVLERNVPPEERIAAGPPQTQAPPIATVSQAGGVSAIPRRSDPCILLELSERLIHARCAGSSARMRWDGQWVFDGGYNESDAVAFFNASEAARRVVSQKPEEAVVPIPEPTATTPEHLPQANPTALSAAASPAPPSQQPVPRPAAAPPPPPSQQPALRPAALPPPPPSQQLAPRPAAAPPPPPSQQPALRPATLSPPPPSQQLTPPPTTAPQQPQQPREASQSRRDCNVSRPKPGFQVYLVTCPNSQVTIGRTVDLTTGWTVSESVNGSEAIDFFMKSPYAR